MPLALEALGWTVAGAFVLLLLDHIRLKRELTKQRAVQEFVHQGLVRDVSERKAAEDGLRRSKRAYAEAYKRERLAVDRLRALDEMKNAFLTAVSHELRTPLTSVLGFAQTLEQRGDVLEPEERALFISRIVANAQRLERLLNDLLDLDRLRRGIIEPRRRPVVVGELVRRVVEDLDMPGDRPLEMDVDGIVVEVDPAKVERIVENLLRNVERHTPAGTRVWIRAEQASEGLLIVVDDDGPGVPPALQLSVFDAFNRGNLEDHAPGAGVGLSLVARLAELHGGRAWVEERPGGGASFRVLLAARVRRISTESGALRVPATERAS